MPTMLESKGEWERGKRSVDERRSISISLVDMSVSLLKKYDLPVEHLDYKYIKECKSIQEVEKILRVLRSGEEGYYPDLIQYCEKKLYSLNPKSKLLLKEIPAFTPSQIGQKEWSVLSEDLKNWSNEIRTKDRYIQSLKDQKLLSDSSPIRNVKDVLAVSNVRKEERAIRKSSHRIKSHDYGAWDKYDVEKELQKIDAEDEAAAKKQKREKYKSLTETSLSAQDELNEVVELKASREKDKGNESYRAGDYDEAIIYYSRSVSLMPSTAAYNNRAFAYIKQEKFEEALSDCKQVLKMEPSNPKAYFRCGVAYKGKKDYANAVKCLQKVLELEPNNKKAKDLLSEISKLTDSSSNLEATPSPRKGKRMTISEVEGSDTESDFSMETPCKALLRGRTGCVQNAIKDSVAPPIPDGASMSESGSETVNSISSLSDILDSTKKGGHKYTKGGIRSDHLVGKIPPSRAREDNGSKIVTHHTGPRLYEQTSDESSPDRQKTYEPSRGSLTAHHQDSRGLISGSDSYKPIYHRQTDNNKADEDSDKTLPDDSPLEHIKSSSRNNGIIEKSESEETEKVLETSLRGGERRGRLTRQETIGDLPSDVVTLKASGNELYKLGQYEDAIQKYNAAVNLIEPLPGRQAHGRQLAVLYSNRAACKIKIGEYVGCIEDCSEALSLSPTAVRPLLRRAVAYEALERYSEAFIDYKQVLAVDTGITQALEGSNRVAQILFDADGPNWREKLPKWMPIMGMSSPSVDDSPPAGDWQNCEENKKNTEESKEQKFQDMKAKGNVSVQKVDRAEFDNAVECYSTCINLFPERVVGYTNRALCYLKLNKPEEALNDCKMALDIDPDNIKALFRQAQAKKMLGYYDESLEDLQVLLKLEPQNYAAKREVHMVNRMKEDKVQTREVKREDPSSNKPRRRLPIEETDFDTRKDSFSFRKLVCFLLGGRSLLEELALRRSVMRSKDELSRSGALTSDTCSVRSYDSRSPSRSRNQSGDQTPTPSGNGSSIDASSPTLQRDKSSLLLKKGTPYEFMQAWNSLKSTRGTKHYAQLLAQVPPSDLPKLLSNKLDGEMLSKILACVRDDILSTGDAERAYFTMASLSNTPRFSMITMFLSEADKKCVDDIFARLKKQPSGTYSSEDTDFLKRKFGL